MSDPSEHAALQTHGVRAVTEYLDGEQVSYDVVEHPQTQTAAAEAREAHVPGDRMAKTVVVHAEGAPVLAVVPATHQLDLDKLRGVLGAAQPLRLATEHELGELFPQFALGAVPCVGPMLVGTTVVDSRLLAHPDVTFAGGDHEHSIRISSPDLVRLADAHVADIGRDWSTGEERVHF